jgi:hypothetical protein
MRERSQRRDRGVAEAQELSSGPTLFGEGNVAIFFLLSVIVCDPFATARGLMNLCVAKC